MDEDDRRQPILAGVSAVTAGALAANVASYLLHLPASRWLGPAGYGEFASLLAAQLLLAVPALALQMVVAREAVAARLRGADARTASRVLGWRCAGLVTLAAAALTWPLAVFLDTSVVATAAALLAAPMLVFLAVEQGLLQGRSQFRRLGLSLAVAGLAKVGPAVAVLAVGGGPAAALLAGSAGTAAAALSARMLSGRPRLSGAIVTATAPVAGVLRASQVQLVLVALTSVDLMLARALLDAESAGLYALGAVATKMAFWLPQAVGVVLYPRMANPAHSAGAVRSAVAVLAAVGAVTVAGAALCGPLVPVLVGGDYRAVAGLLWLFALHGSVLAVLQGALISAIAQDTTGVAALAWVGLLVEGLLLAGFGTGVASFAVIAAATATATTAAVVAVVLGAPAHRARTVHSRAVSGRKTV